MKVDFNKGWIAMIVVIVVIGGAVIFFRAPVTGPQDQSNVSSQIVVAATVFPIYDMVRIIGGSQIDARLLVPAGSPPELFNLASRRQDMDAAAIIFAIGHGFDTETIPPEFTERVFTVDNNVDLLLKEGATASPHYWLSVKQMFTVARNITDKLIELDPENESDYKERFADVQRRLTWLDATIEELLVEVPQRLFVVHGYDWEYFARDYDLTIRAYVPVDSGNVPAEDSLQDVQEAVDAAGLVSAFGEIRHAPDPLLPLMASRRFTIFYLDALGGVEDRKDYISNMAYNAQTLFEGLSM